MTTTGFDWVAAAGWVLIVIGAAGVAWAAYAYGGLVLRRRAVDRAVAREAAIAEAVGAERAWATGLSDQLRVSPRRAPILDFCGVCQALDTYSPPVCRMSIGGVATFRHPGQRWDVTYANTQTDLCTVHANYLDMLAATVEAT